MSIDITNNELKYKSTLSVVIPTLGGECLVETLNKINAGSLIPDRIYICIPLEYASKVDGQVCSNIEVIKTKNIGQVAQRAEGLATANTDYIVQLDDDMLLDKFCLERLMKAIVKLDSSAISPAFTNIETGNSLYRINSTTLFKKIYYWLINGKAGYQPGTITQAGTCFGVDASIVNQDFLEVDWLPGGCVIHKKANIVTENYYPFSGKAYAEDLYFSSIARSKGLKLYICTGANCQVEPMPPLVTMTYKEFKNFLASDLKVRKNFVIQSGLSLLRMYYFYLVIIAYYLAGKCRRIF